MHAVLLQRGWTVLATSISSLLLEYDVSQLSVELTEGGTQSCERFVSVNWEFSQFCTSSAANSLPVHGTLEGQNKSTLRPEKPSFKFFEIFLLSELAFTYDKLDVYAKTNCVMGTLITLLYSPTDAAPQFP